MKTKKTSIPITCLFLLSILIGSNLLIPVTHPASADSEDVYAYPFHEVVIQPDTSSPHGLSPAQIRSIYNLPSTGGTGTIAIVDAYDDPTVFNDANVFSKQYGLSNLTSTTFEKHMMASNIAFDPSWATEISLDVQWAHAIAPNAKILLVEATSDQLTANGAAGPLLNAVDYARNRSDVVAISMSWGTGSGGFPTESNYDSHFTSSFGVTFFASSGDHAENASYPAASPNVVGVGGTTLNFNPNGSFANETVWNDNGVATGGGVSPYELEPSYQVSYGVQSNGHRAVPDVSYYADQNPGYPIYTSYSGSAWLTVGGTSAGSPQWAAIKSLGLFGSNDRFYAIASSPSYSSCFRDISVGSNGHYNAEVGYDCCTGLGSPITTTFHYPPGITGGEVGITGYKLVFGEAMYNPYDFPMTINYSWNFNVDKWNGTQWVTSGISGSSTPVTGYSIPAFTIADLPYYVYVLPKSDVAWGDWLKISYSFNWTYDGVDYSTSDAVELNVHPGDIAGAASVTFPYLGANGIVSGADLNLLSLYWGLTVPSGTDPTSALARADINGDGKVNSADMNQMGSDWGKTWINTPPG
jgi:hypothetical protein